METLLKQEDFAARAIHLWEQAGHHHRRDLEYWVQAEAELGAALPSGRTRESASKSDLENSSLVWVEEVLALAW
jgi:hypothetical protein